VNSQTKILIHAIASRYQLYYKATRNPTKNSTLSFSAGLALICRANKSLSQ
jgi:hypothetical protein